MGADIIRKSSMILRRYSILFLLLILVIVASMLSPRFFTVGNFLNLLQQSSVIGIVSIGMTFVIITGGLIFLSAQFWH